MARKKAGDNDTWLDDYVDRLKVLLKEEIVLGKSLDKKKVEDYEYAWQRNTEMKSHRERLALVASDVAKAVILKREIGNMHGIEIHPDGKINVYTTEDDAE